MRKYGLQQFSRFFLEHFHLWLSTNNLTNRCIHYCKRYSTWSQKWLPEVEQARTPLHSNYMKCQTNGGKCCCKFLSIFKSYLFIHKFSFSSPKHSSHKFVLVRIEQVIQLHYNNHGIFNQLIYLSSGSNIVITHKNSTGTRTGSQHNVGKIFLKTSHILLNNSWRDTILVKLVKSAYHPQRWSRIQGNS